MSTSEQVVTIISDQRETLGILSIPAPSHTAKHTGVLLLVGGAQYRAGSHRQFVQLARHLASTGHPALRFDFPGMGDSPGEAVSFEATAAHIGAAIHQLMHHRPELTGVVLWGLCDGASAGLLYLHDTADPRVQGLVLLNPWVRSENTLASTTVRHYYRARLLEKAFWAKLLKGGVGFKALGDLCQNLKTMRRPAPKAIRFQEKMAKAWQTFTGPILLLLSEHDLTAREFLDLTQHDEQWRSALLARAPMVVHLTGADHTCSTNDSSDRVQQLVSDWMRQMQPSRR